MLWNNFVSLYVVLSFMCSFFYNLLLFRNVLHLEHEDLMNSKHYGYQFFVHFRLELHYVMESVTSKKLYYSNHFTSNLYYTCRMNEYNESMIGSRIII